MLPGPYEGWYVAITGRASPVETRSTCDACVMLPGADGLPLEGAFDPALRCCTYHPHLAPHFVGGILAGAAEAGRAVVRARIAARDGVTPLGLGPSAAYDATYRRVTVSPGVFGHSRDLLCPFYADARCTIWSWRGTPCAAFHCKLDRGTLGARLWGLIVIAFEVIERRVTRWVVEQSGLDPMACDAFLRAPGDAAADARAWGDWRGREEDYFTAAARRVEPLSWAEVAAIGGDELRDLGAALHAALGRLAAMTPPARVRRGPEVLYQIGQRGHQRVHHPAVPFDPLEVPADLAARLAALTSAALTDLGLPPELAQRLLDWEVLAPA